MYRSTRRLPVPVIEPADVVPMPDRSGMLSSLEAVCHEVREIGDEYVDAVLQLITDCALSLTGASGAALAFLTEDKMICRARAGEPTPPLGAPLDVKQGLSGECVRSGLLVSCDDVENDPRVDPEGGRTLGIGSLMAVPIVSDFRVVGLL
jgi:GAF domain